MEEFTENLDRDVDTRNKKAFKIYAEALKRLDSYTSTKAVSVSALFAPEPTLLRWKLRDSAEKLIIFDLFGHGIKIFDTYWRKGFYETYINAKQIKKDETDEMLIKNHLYNGIGHYHHLLFCLEENYEGKKLNLDFGTLSLFGDVRKKPNISIENEKILKQIYYKCLICLGDLSRYMLEYSNDVSLPKRYYYQALTVGNYAYGLPLNQLGSLSDSDNYSLDAVLFYFRSLLSEHKFDGAHENLKTLLCKNEEKKVFEQNDNYGDNNNKSVLALLNLLNALLFQEQSESLSELCSISLNLFQQTLQLDNESSDYFRPMERLADIHGSDIFTKVALIIICGIEYSVGRRNSSYMEAYLLSLFSHFVNKLHLDLKLELFGPEAVFNEESPKKKIISKLDQKFRRKKRQTSTNDDDDDDDDDSFLTESSDSMSEGNDTSEDENEIHFSDDEIENLSLEDEIIIEDSLNITTTYDCLNALNKHPLVPAVRVIFTWLLSFPDKFSSDESLSVLWTHVQALFQIVDLQNSKYVQGEEFKTTQLPNKGLSPFPEDWLLRGLRPFVKSLEFIDWNSLLDPCPINQGLRRIEQFNEFKLWFYQKRRQSENTSESKETNEKENLMVTMAQLWLQQKVLDLETEGSPSLLSPYIVIDHFALSQQLHLVKTIVYSTRFAVIIPIAVIQELDVMKKMMNGARNAIRWLEKQFQEGNRCLRAQKKHEFRSLSNTLYPKKRNKKEWNYFSILECCKYFSCLRNESTIVTLLTGKDETLPSTFTSALCSLNVRVQQIEGFLKLSSKKKKSDLR